MYSFNGGRNVLVTFIKMNSDYRLVKNYF